ncbi:hypothetical protein Dimus_032384 [Dionaea muscipula]
MAEAVSRSTAFLSRSCLFPTGRSCCSSRKNSSSTRLTFPLTSSSSSVSGHFCRLRNIAADLNGGQSAVAASNPPPSHARQSVGRLSIGKAHKWWEKGLQPNMKEITSAQDLVDSLLNAGDKLVVVDFFSPGCGGCKALHPKICQLAEMNPDVQFLQVNYEEHKSMCYSLHVHVLPFFRFYRGAEGRLCSFSCTNATISKFKNALAKHNTPRCPLGPLKGLEEKELLALVANKDLSFTYTPKNREPETVPSQHEAVVAQIVADNRPPLSLATQNLHQGSGEVSLVTAGR